MLSVDSHFSGSPKEKTDCSEELAISILDAYGKGFLYTRDEENGNSPSDRLRKLLQHHKDKKKLIVVSHIDWIFDDDSFGTRELFETFVNSLTLTNTTFIFTACGIPRSGFSDSFAFARFHVRSPALDDPKRGLSTFLANHLPDYEDEHLELIKQILKVSNYKMELLGIMTSELNELSSFSTSPFETSHYLEEFRSFTDLKTIANKVAENLNPEELRLLNFLRLFPSYFRFEDCLGAKDEKVGFDDDKIKRALTNLYQRDVVKKSKMGAFVLADIMREMGSFHEIAAQQKKLFVIHVLRSLLAKSVRTNLYLVTSLRKNLRCALALMNLEDSDTACFASWAEVREVVLQIGVENFPIILDNMMHNLGGSSVKFFKTVLKNCSDELDNGSVEEAWLKVVLKSFHRRRSLPSMEPVLVICFEKYIAIAEKVRDSGEDDWDALIAELEGVSREMASCEDVEKDYVVKLNAQIEPLMSQLKCFHRIYGEMNACIDRIKHGCLDISAASERRLIEKKIQSGLNLSCNILREAAIELKVAAEIKMKVLAGNEETKKERELFENEHKGNMTNLQNEIVNLRNSLGEMEAERRREREEREAERKKE